MTDWPKRAAVMATAKSLLGLGESPDGSNHNMITEAYGIGDGPWCAMFVWWVYKQNGVDLREEFGEDWAWTPSAVAAAQAKGMWVPGLQGVQPGDAIFFDIPGGEVGYVNHVGIATDTTGATIDGNWQNKVSLEQHPLRYAKGYIRMPLDDRFTPAPESNAPAFPGRIMRLTEPMLHGDDVRDWQQRMHDRGWTIDVDGWYGPQSKQVCRQFQAEKGLTVDGEVGPITWVCAFRTDNVT